MNRYLPTEDYVKTLGRTAYIDGITWCAFSGTGIEFVVRAKSLTIELVGDSTTDDTQNGARVGIYIDGERAVSWMLFSKEISVEVFNSETERVHVISVVKLSESAMSTFGIKGIVTDGEIAKTAKKDVLIEFIGDSITCGYGVDDENELHSFKTSTEDCTQSFAYRTASKLGVDYSIVSFSGYGVLSGYTGTGEINSKELLPPHYEKLGFSYALSGTAENSFKVEDIAWDFSKLQPDVVFINLGTNDASYCGEDKDKQQGYIDRYYQFLQLIRRKNPKAYIVCGLGIMGDTLFPCMCEAAELFKKNIDNRIDTVYFSPIDADKEGYVADYHPTSRTHERAANILADKLKEVISREYGIKTGCRSVALTFDDGPSLTTTNEILDVLERKGIKASFFLVGSNIKPETETVVKRQDSLGCDIENHSYTHSAFSSLTKEEMLEELEKTGSRIKALTGKEPEFFRPPYIAVDDNVAQTVPLTMIAGYGAEDWEENVTANMRVARILSQLKDGCVILLHDSEGNKKTAQAVEPIIDAAARLGYRFVTISELFKERNVTPQKGVVISAV